MTTNEINTSAALGATASKLNAFKDSSLAPTHYDTLGGLFSNLTDWTFSSDVEIKLPAKGMEPFPKIEVSKVSNLPTTLNFHEMKERVKLDGSIDATYRLRVHKKDRTIELHESGSMFFPSTSVRYITHFGGPSNPTSMALHPAVAAIWSPSIDQSVLSSIQNVTRLFDGVNANQLTLSIRHALARKENLGFENTRFVFRLAIMYWMSVMAGGYEARDVTVVNPFDNCKDPIYLDNYNKYSELVVRSSRGIRPNFCYIKVGINVLNVSLYAGIIQTACSSVAPTFNGFQGDFNHSIASMWPYINELTPLIHAEQYEFTHLRHTFSSYDMWNAATTWCYQNGLNELFVEAVASIAPYTYRVEGKDRTFGSDTTIFSLPTADMFNMLYGPLIVADAKSTNVNEEAFRTMEPPYAGEMIMYGLYQSISLELSFKHYIFRRLFVMGSIDANSHGADFVNRFATENSLKFMGVDSLTPIIPSLNEYALSAYKGNVITRMLSAIVCYRRPMHMHSIMIKPYNHWLQDEEAYFITRRIGNNSCLASMLIAINSFSDPVAGYYYVPDSHTDGIQDSTLMMSSVRWGKMAYALCYSDPIHGKLDTKDLNPHTNSHGRLADYAFYPMNYKSPSGVCYAWRYKLPNIDTVLKAKHTFERQSHLNVTLETRRMQSALLPMEAEEPLGIFRDFGNEMAGGAGATPIFSLLGEGGSGDKDTNSRSGDSKTGKYIKYGEFTSQKQGIIHNDPHVKEPKKDFEDFSFLFGLDDEEEKRDVKDDDFKFGFFDLLNDHLDENEQDEKEIFTNMSSNPNTSQKSQNSRLYVPPHDENVYKKTTITELFGETPLAEQLQNERAKMTKAHEVILNSSGRAIPKVDRDPNALDFETAFVDPMNEFRSKEEESKMEANAYLERYPKEQVKMAMKLSQALIAQNRAIKNKGFGTTKLTLKDMKHDTDDLYYNKDPTADDIIPVVGDTPLIVSQKAVKSHYLNLTARHPNKRTKDEKEYIALFEMYNNKETDPSYVNAIRKSNNKKFANKHQKIADTTVLVTENDKKEERERLHADTNSGKGNKSETAKSSSNNENQRKKTNASIVGERGGNDSTPKLSSEQKKAAKEEADAKKVEEFKLKQQLEGVKIEKMYDTNQLKKEDSSRTVDEEEKVVEDGDEDLQVHNNIKLTDSDAESDELSISMNNEEEPSKHPLDPDAINRIDVKDIETLTREVEENQKIPVAEWDDLQHYTFLRRIFRQRNKALDDVKAACGESFEMIPLTKYHKEITERNASRYVTKYKLVDETEEETAKHPMDFVLTNEAAEQLLKVDIKTLVTQADVVERGKVIDAIKYLYLSSANAIPDSFDNVLQLKLSTIEVLETIYEKVPYDVYSEYMAANTNKNAVAIENALKSFNNANEEEAKAAEILKNMAKNILGVDLSQYSNDKLHTQALEYLNSFIDPEEAGIYEDNLGKHFDAMIKTKKCLEEQKSLEAFALEYKKLNDEREANLITYICQGMDIKDAIQVDFNNCNDVFSKTLLQKIEDVDLMVRRQKESHIAKFIANTKYEDNFNNAKVPDVNKYDWDPTFTPFNAKKAVLLKNVVIYNDEKVFRRLHDNEHDDFLPIGWELVKCTEKKVHDPIDITDPNVTAKFIDDTLSEDLRAHMENSNADGESEQKTKSPVIMDKQSSGDGNTKTETEKLGQDGQSNTNVVEKQNVKKSSYKFKDALNHLRNAKSPISLPKTTTVAFGKTMLKDIKLYPTEIANLDSELETTKLLREMHENAKKKDSEHWNPKAIEIINTIDAWNLDVDETIRFSDQCKFDLVKFRAEKRAEMAAKGKAFLAALEKIHVLKEPKRENAKKCQAWLWKNMHKYAKYAKNPEETIQGLGCMQQNELKRLTGVLPNVTNLAEVIDDNREAASAIVRCATRLSVHENSLINMCNKCNVRIPPEGLHHGLIGLLQVKDNKEETLILQAAASKEMTDIVELRQNINSFASKLPMSKHRWKTDKELIKSYFRLGRAAFSILDLGQQALIIADKLQAKLEHRRSKSIQDEKGKPPDPKNLKEVDTGCATSSQKQPSTTHLLGSMRQNTKGDSAIPNFPTGSTVADVSDVTSVQLEAPKLSFQTLKPPEKK